MIAGHADRRHAQASAHRRELRCLRAARLKTQFARRTRFVRADIEPYRPARRCRDQRRQRLHGGHCCNNCLRLASRSPRVRAWQPERRKHAAQHVGRDDLRPAGDSRATRPRYRRGLRGRGPLRHSSVDRGQSRKRRCSAARQPARAASSVGRKQRLARGQRRIGTASAPRLLASVSIAPSPSRQRATTAFGPTASAVERARAIQARHDLRCAQRDEPPIQRLARRPEHRIAHAAPRQRTSPVHLDPGSVRGWRDRRMPETWRIRCDALRAPRRQAPRGGR